MRAYVSELGVQRAIRIAVEELRRALPHVTVVQSQGVFEPTREMLPIIRLSWRERYAGFLARPEYPLCVDAVPTVLSFQPKCSGRQRGFIPTILYDPDADFSYVVAGDVVVDVASGARGTVQTVIDIHALQLSGVELNYLTPYEIHWSADALKHYPQDHRAVLEFDIYGDPAAAYGELRTVDEIARELVGLCWTTLRRAWQQECVEVVEVERVADVSGLLTSTGFGPDWYERVVVEATLIVGDSYAVRVPTVERVGIRYKPQLTPADMSEGPQGYSGFEDP